MLRSAAPLRSRSTLVNAVASFGMSTRAPRDEPSVRPVPLKSVVQASVHRWFEDTLADAERGDVKQQALLSQMLAEGYGCQQNLRAAGKWAERARMRGYKMKGVYCEL